MELNKTGADFIRYPNDSKLYLTVLPKLTLNNISEFGVSEVRRQLLLHILGTVDLSRILQTPDLYLHQLPVIQYGGIKSSGTLQTQ